MSSKVTPTLLEEMTMSKLTPMILAVLMLASTSLVAMDWAELENNTMTEADGRSVLTLKSQAYYRLERQRPTA